MEALIVKELPSRFVPYKEFGIRHIEIISYSLAEITYLSSPNLPTSSVMKTLGKVITNIDVMQLTWWDAFYLQVYATFFAEPTQKWMHKVQCPHCKTICTHQVTAQNFFEFDDLSDKIKSLPVEVEFSDRKYLIGPITVADQVDLMENPELNELNAMISMYAKMVKNAPFKEAYEFFMNTRDHRDIKLIQYLVELLETTSKPIIKKCANSECNYTYRIDMELEVSNFTPFREQEDDLQSRINFG